MFIDIACAQRKKYNQNAYGDYFTSGRFSNMNRVVAVLSDGLGSGIKANILACMTSTMLLKFLENEDSSKIKGTISIDFGVLKRDNRFRFYNEFINTKPEVREIFKSTDSFHF